MQLIDQLDAEVRRHLPQELGSITHQEMGPRSFRFWGETPNTRYEASVRVIGKGMFSCVVRTHTPDGVLLCTKSIEGSLPST